jgi:hypothetical protein
MFPIRLREVQDCGLGLERYRDSATRHFALFKQIRKACLVCVGRWGGEDGCSIRREWADGTITATVAVAVAVVVVVVNAVLVVEAVS